MFEAEETLLLGVSNEWQDRSLNGLVSQTFDALLAKIKDKTAQIGIIGLGYVGLPLARTFVDQGYDVLGFDTDANKVEKLQSGLSYIGHITDDVVRRMRAQRFE